MPPGSNVRITVGRTSSMIASRRRTTSSVSALAKQSAGRTQFSIPLSR